MQPVVNSRSTLLVDKLDRFTQTALLVGWNVNIHKD